MNPPVTAWYGKLPVRGDFVGQGLPPTWTVAWDACLQQALALGWRRGPREVFDRRVRAFPPWRYLAWPDGVDGRVWAGVLVPSHDRVGRAFPFTVAQALAAEQLQGRDWLDIEAALARLADAALDVTDPADPALMDDFVAVLTGLAPVFRRREGESARTTDAAPLPELAGVSGVSGACALWWCPPAPGVAPRPLGTAWPPAPERLLAFIEATAGPEVGPVADRPETPGTGLHRPG